MTNAPGLRDQRLKLYRRENKGTDGFTSPVFVLDVTRWGRVDDSTAIVRMVGERLQLKIDAVAEFADEVDVPRDGLVIDETDTSIAWWVRGIITLRQLRRVRAGLERIASEVFSTFTLHDSAGSLDGTHIVNPT